ncbi:ATP-binding protein [Fictibacillus fluitans]|uniref:histidine kinase n=1 Tax=Fictibacillus fluitans TaxID=3058422 RepID=A0ABT8HWT5_9BACL|nr:ATP-binding protein [Fictibacillus sp. NE201]MDN4524717.1 ATP-binding protein [Fictibacillus sp. NE201]
MNEYCSEQIDVIRGRNHLLYKVLWGFFIVDLLINFWVDPEIALFMLPLGAVVFGIVTYFSVSNRYPVFTMYFTVSSFYFFLFCLLWVQPILVNYIYIWFCLILSTIYHQCRVIIYAGLLSIAMSAYFFVADRELFANVEDFDLIFIILFIVVATLFFAQSSQFTETLRLNSEKREKQTASKLTETREYFHSVISQTADAILVQTLKGDIMTVNRAFLELYGWNEEEMKKTPFQHIPSTQKTVINEVLRKIVNGEAVMGYEMVNQKKSGELFPVSVTFSPIRNGDGSIRAIAGIYRDITEAKRTEELIIQSEKLSVIGQLAAGVAHEIRNPLAILSGFVQFMREEKISEEYTGIMLTEINRMNQILEEYMQLAKAKPFTAIDLDLTALVKETLVLMEAFASLSNISIHYTMLADSCLIKGDANSLKQVLINLIKNAVEASEQGSKIEVSVKRADGYATIEVKDEGQGLAHEDLKRLGEPFFTKKETGTGLGLMVSFKIIELHQGEITVTSEPNAGTVFSVMLPELKKQQ